MSVLAAGGVVYRQHTGFIEVVMVVPVKEPDRWALPKGHQEPAESIEATALREVHEETGLQVMIERSLGSSAYTYIWQGQAIDKQVYYYLMQPVGGSFSDHDHEMTQVLWLPLPEALARVTFESEAVILRRAEEHFRQLPAK